MTLRWMKMMGRGSDKNPIFFVRLRAMNENESVCANSAGSDPRTNARICTACAREPDLHRGVADNPTLPGHVQKTPEGKVQQGD